MPELPEVENICRSLSSLILGKSITGVALLKPEIIVCPDEAEFKKSIKNRTFIDLKRRGKYILFFLDKELVLVVHLRMTGRLVISSPQEKILPHTHLILYLSGKKELRFTDTRRFGRIYLLPKSDLNQIKGIDSLGSEPLDSAFTLEVLSFLLDKHKRTLKSFLLDQHIIAGIGNIYADEILAYAYLHPMRLTNSLTKEEKVRLFNAIKFILNKAILKGGTTFRDYVNGLGEKGKNQDSLLVYKKEKEPCFRCGCSIVRQKIAGRSTYFCPNCQKNNLGADL